MNWTEIVVGAIVSGLIATGITFAVSRIAKRDTRCVSGTKP